MKDQLNIEILEDGTVSITTGEFSDSKHIAADDLVEELKDFIGGDIVVKENPESPAKLFWKNREVKGKKIVHTAK